MFFFFFSSRRRHTRLQGDWSSDVCSSDLFGWRLCSRSSATDGDERRNRRGADWRGGHSQTVLSPRGRSDTEGRESKIPAYRNREGRNTNIRNCRKSDGCVSCVEKMIANAAGQLIVYVSDDPIDDAV